MNKTRRQELSRLIKDLRSAKTQEEIGSMINVLENIRDDEESYYDNIPENLQGGQRACDSECAIDNMNDAIDLLESAQESDDADEMCDKIEQAINKINDVRY